MPQQSGYGATNGYTLNSKQLVQQSGSTALFSESYEATAPTTANGQGGFSLHMTVTGDTRSVMLTRPGATSADTIYSYDPQSFGGGAQGSLPNTQIIQSVLVGNWGVRSGYSWSPDGGSSSAVNNPVQMPFSSVEVDSNYNPVSGQPGGPQTMNVAYSCTDSNDGATANANYVLTVHEVYESTGDDSSSNAIGPPITPPGAVWVANTTGQTQHETVGVTQGGSQTEGLALTGSGGPWELLKLGVNLSYTYSVTWTATATASADCPNNTETILQVGANYSVHTGHLNNYGAGGFLGKSAYTINIPNGTYISAATPVPITAQKP